MTVSVELVLLVLSCLFLLSLLVSKAGTRFGVPVLLLFLGVGMLAGSDGLGIHFDNLVLAQAIGTTALCIILFAGGLDTKYEEIKPVMKVGVTLATLGVLMTAAITGLFIWFCANKLMPSLNITLLESLLLASIMSSTDSASVFAILRSKGISLKHNLRPLLELESGSNDPMAYLLTITFIQLIMATKAVSVPAVALQLVGQLTIGALAGYFLGKLSVRVLNRIDLANDALYPVLLFTCCIFIFSITYFIQGNGYLAVYIGGLVIGNSRFITKRSSLRFFSGLAWLSQIMMFLTLGLLVNPHELIAIAVPATIISVFMIVAGRPLSVFACMLPFKYTLQDKLFVSWVGLRGAVPIVFAILPLAAGVPHARELFNIVFFITLISLLVQGSTLAKVADWLGLSNITTETPKLQDFDMEFSDDIKSAMTEITVNDKVLEKGNMLMNMILPDKTLVVMVKRDQKYFIPKGNTELHAGDKLLVISDDENALRETYKAMGIPGY